MVWVMGRVVEVLSLLSVVMYLRMVLRFCVIWVILVLFNVSFVSSVIF